MSQRERAPVRSSRSLDEVRQHRLEAVAAWHKAAELRELAETGGSTNRETATEDRRRLDALRRATAVVVARSEALDAAPLPTQDPLPARAVVVHRHDWLRGQLEKGLGDQGLCVVAAAADGADGLGITIAEQPDLLVIEDRLPSVRAEELVNLLRSFAPHTLVAAQVEHDTDADVMLAAGASAVFNRRIPPFQVCEQLAALLKLRPDEPLILS